MQKVNGKSKMVPILSFACFSASQEVQYTNVYNLRKNNYDALRRLDVKEMVKEILSAMPKDMGVCRIHVAGDFFNEDYFYAWLVVANLNPHILFYAYTKSVKYWIANMDFVNERSNFVLTASYGGREDGLIGSQNLRSAKVIFLRRRGRFARSGN